VLLRAREGQRLRLLDSPEDGFARVRAADGREGWMAEDAVAPIRR
jgi:hypothetical protein